MRDWMDFDGDGEVDSCERMFAEEMLCTSKEEHEALFGDAGDFDDDMEDDFEIDAMAAGLDVDELELMDPEGTTGIFIWDGKEIPLKPGEQVISLSSRH